MTKPRRTSRPTRPLEPSTLIQVLGGFTPVYKPSSNAINIGTGLQS